MGETIGSSLSGIPSAAWWQFLRTLTALQRSSPQKKSWQTRKKSLKPSSPNSVKEITELIQEREGAYTDYQDASALKYSHVPSASRVESKEKKGIWGMVFGS